LLIPIVFALACFGCTAISELQGQEIASDAIAIEPNNQTTDPNQLVLNAIDQLVWGPSFACSIQQTTELEGQTTLAVGDYWHAGQGSGQFKLSQRFSVNESVTTLLQTSDGRGMRTLFGSTQKLHSLNLDRIRQSLGTISPERPDREELSIYLAIGGQPEIVRMLYHRYRWTKAFAGAINDEEVWQLIGTLRTDPPRIRGNAPVDVISLRSDPPAILPTDVRLTLRRGGPVPLSPKRIEYFRRIQDDQGNHSMQQFSAIEYRNLKSPISNTEGLFRYSGEEDAEQIVDETPNYMPPSEIATHSLNVR
jgi:hypothetical protein